MKALVALLVASALLLVGCSDSTEPGGSLGADATITTIWVPTTIDFSLLPGLPAVGAFIEEHDEFGTAVWAMTLSDWAQGKRFRVSFDTERSLLFYLKDGMVVSVYESDAEDGRVLVWGERREAEATGPVQRSEESDLPSYTILFHNEMLSGVFGGVLVPSISRESSVEEREALARAIVSREGLDEVMLYCTEDAYAANWSLSYAEAHPNAMRDGFLGMLRDGAFTPGEVLYP